MRDYGGARMKAGVLVVVAFAAISVAVSSWMAWEVRGDAEVMRAAIEAAKRGARMQTITTTWQDADGVTHTVATTRLDGESVDAWIARHQALVAAAQAKYPPIN